MTRRWLTTILVVCVVLAPLGCRPRNQERDPSAPPSRVAHFKERQAATQLTHGRIRLDSVAEHHDGRIRYQTSDGKTWLVDMTPDANGGYRYGMPEEVKN
jgi:hypothetical protein